MFMFTLTLKADVCVNKPSGIEMLRLKYVLKEIKK